MKRLWYTDLYRSYRKASASVASTETLPQNALAILSRTADKSWKSSSFSNSGIGRISWLRDPRSTQVPASFVFSVPRSPFARCKEFPPRGISPAATSTWGRRPSSWFKAELVVGAAFGYLNMGRKRASLDRLLHEVLKFGRYLDISTNLAPWFCIPSTLVMDIRKDGITTQFCHVLPSSLQVVSSWWKISGSWWSATSSPGRSTATAPRLGCWWLGMARARRRRGHPKPHHWGKLWMERGDPGRIFRYF